MKAIGYFKSLPISDADALVERELPEPVPGEFDLLVEVQAVSVNPVDVKVRTNVAPGDGQMKVLGWDAAGVVRAVGASVALFKPGDRVWYAGDLTRQGSNSELQLVDERIAGPMPESLDFAHAAALPLTAITAWELLFDRLKVQYADPYEENRLLVVGAAGGVGSILVQLARQLTGWTVIGTASRPETQDWVAELGAHHVIDHSKPLVQELERVGLPQVKAAISLNRTDLHMPHLIEALEPEGQLALIDDPKTLDVLPMKRKSLSLHWEFMYTRSMFQRPNMIRQHQLLRKIASLIDSGVLRTTLTEQYGRIDASNLKRAHALIERGQARGKIVLSGF
jgi:zinc-binding alcohol dehydrogenase family protein